VQLQKHLLAQNLQAASISCYDSIDQALNVAVATVKEDQKVVVAGSFVTVSQALALL
jgi:folylpolyglutamate synthase/dihydropteroate synthase